MDIKVEIDEDIAGACEELPTDSLVIEGCECDASLTENGHDDESKVLEEMQLSTDEGCPTDINENGPADESAVGKQEVQLSTDEGGATGVNDGEINLSSNDTEQPAVETSPGSEKMESGIISKFKKLGNVEMSFMDRNRKQPTLHRKQREKFADMRAIRYFCGLKMLKLNNIKSNHLDLPIMDNLIHNCTMFVDQQGASLTALTKKTARTFTFVFASEPETTDRMRVARNNELHLTMAKAFTNYVDIIPSQGNTGYMHLDINPPLKSLVFVYNLSDNAREQDVRVAFPFLSALTIPTNVAGKNLGYAWLIFPTHVMTAKESERSDVEVSGQKISMMMVTFPPKKKNKNNLPLDLHDLLKYHTSHKSVMRDGFLKPKNPAWKTDLKANVYTEIGRTMQSIIEGGPAYRGRGPAFSGRGRGRWMSSGGRRPSSALLGMGSGGQNLGRKGRGWNSKQNWNQNWNQNESSYGQNCNMMQSIAPFRNQMASLFLAGNLGGGLSVCQLCDTSGHTAKDCPMSNLSQLSSLLGQQSQSLGQQAQQSIFSGQQGQSSGMQSQSYSQQGQSLRKQNESLRQQVESFRQQDRSYGQQGQSYGQQGQSYGQLGQSYGQQGQSYGQQGQSYGDYGQQGRFSNMSQLTPQSKKKKKKQQAQTYNQNSSGMSSLFANQFQPASMAGGYQSGYQSGYSNENPQQRYFSQSASAYTQWGSGSQPTGMQPNTLDNIQGRLMQTATQSGYGQNQRGSGFHWLDGGRRY